ncbi:MAG: hypothetical protein IH984_01925 [Planctomycetes bacterium]|nr:hypothetical protein [Planctomycetota bacterium]
MDDRSIEIERFTFAIDLIRKKFPEVHIVIDEDEIDEYYFGMHTTADIKRQPGVDFDIGINLQNRDELHLCAETLWACYFPVGEKGPFDKFIDALFGLLSGEYRIVEHLLWGSLIKTELQKPCGREWQTIFTSSAATVILELIPLPRKKRYIQNLIKT